MTPTAEYLSAASAPPSSDPCWKWMEKSISLDATAAIQGRYSTEHVPFIRVVFERYQNIRTRQLTVMVSAQSTKTQNAINALLWSVDQDPATTMWIMADADHMKDFYKTRLIPAIYDCCPTVAAKAPNDRSSISGTLIQFDTMNLIMRGSNSRTKLQSDPVRRLICDERREWKKGAIHLVRKRTRTFHNFTEFSMGTAGKVNDELHNDWKEGSQTFIHVNCLGCGKSQPIRFSRDPSSLHPDKLTLGGFVCEKDGKEARFSDFKNPDGTYDFDALKPAVRWQCQQCGRLHKNTEKAALLRTWHEHHRNPDALPKHYSVHWWAAYMPWASCDWGELTEEFIKANHKAKPENGGDLEGLIAFVTETLGEPWEERGEKPLEGEILNRRGEYSRGEEYPPNEKVARQITVDNQHGFIHYNYSVFNLAGEKRTVERGQLATFDELRAYQLAKKVKDRGVGVDCAHKPHDVYAQCLKYGCWVPDPRGGREHVWNGWVPLLGDDAEEFVRSLRDKDGNAFQVKTYWKEVLIDTNIGRAGQAKHIHRFSWSNPYYKTQLFLYRINGKGLKWEIYKNIEDEYVKQMQATERREVRDAEGKVTGHEWHEKGRHDDGDCELMQLVLADINGITTPKKI